MAQINNLEEKKKIIELLIVSLASAPITPKKDLIVIQWHKRWKDFSIENNKDIRLRIYQGHLVKSKTQAKLEGENFTYEYPELDAILQEIVNEYMDKYVQAKCNKTTVRKNIKIFTRELETYRKSCVDNLNKILQEHGSDYVAKNTSIYVKHYKSGHLTKGLMDLAKYSLIYNGNKLYSGTYDEVLRFLGKNN